MMRLYTQMASVFLLFLGLSLSASGKTQEETQDKALRRIELDRLHAEALLKRTPHGVSGKTLTLRFKVRLVKQCGIGDGDAIKLEMEEMPYKKLRVSLEKLSGATVVYSSELGSDFIQKGEKEVSFDIPWPKVAVLYGVYVCLTQNNQQCSLAKTTDINQVLSQYINRSTLTPEDRTYFFQPLLVEKESISSFSLVPRSTQAYEGLRKYLNELNNDFTPGLDEMIATDSVVSKVSAMLNVLGSFTVEFAPDTINILLPIYEKDSCHATSP